MKKVWIIALLIIVLLAVTACAANVNELQATPNADGQVAGFWRGLWQGFIAPFAFLVSLFNHNIGIYEIHNSGGWYNFGYLVGLSAIFGGGGSAGCRARKR